MSLRQLQYRDCPECGEQRLFNATGCPSHPTTAAYVPQPEIVFGQTPQQHARRMNNIAARNRARAKRLRETKTKRLLKSLDHHLTRERT
jgi:hypothetical protein